MSTAPKLLAESKHRQTSILSAVIIIGLATMVLMARWLDRHRPKIESEVQQESLYLTGNTVRRMSLGFNGLVADWYWMRSLQYVGRKILDAPAQVQLDNLAQLDLRLLAPLLDIATTLDPEFMEPYQYAAVVLPAIDEEAAIRIIRKGIAANPTQWRLHQHLGYIYWQRRDFNSAGQAYANGAVIPGAPPWMNAMKARMAAEGGSRHTAREIYTRMYEEAGDSQVKETAYLRLLQLDSMDQRESIRKVLAAYKVRVGKCPAAWRDVAPLLRGARLSLSSDGAPLDPVGTPYILVTDNCDVDLDPRSDVPYK